MQPYCKVLWEGNFRLADDKNNHEEQSRWMDLSYFVDSVDFSPCNCPLSSVQLCLWHYSWPLPLRKCMSCPQKSADLTFSHLIFQQRKKHTLSPFGRPQWLSDCCVSCFLRQRRQWRGDNNTTAASFHLGLSTSLWRDLLDHTDVCLHVHHVSVPPVILEAHHQRVWLEAAEASSLRGGTGEITTTRIHTTTHFLTVSWAFDLWGDLQHLLHLLVLLLLKISFY